MNKVIVFRQNLLPRSETFIKEQVLAFTRWQATLTGYRLVPDGLNLYGLDTHLLPGLGGRWQRLFLRLCQRLWLSHSPTVRALRKLNGDLLHAHFGTDAVDIWPSVRKLGLPMLVTLHGYDISIYREWWEAGHGGVWRRQYPRRLLEMARNSNVQFIAVSKAIYQRAIEFGIPADKLEVHHIGINTKLFQPASPALTARPRRVLFIGRLVEKKGVEYLLQCFTAIHSKLPDAELIIVGDGPLRKHLNAMAVTLDRRVHFLGELTPEKIREQMSKARILCLPSVTASNGDSEGLPTVLLEAQACGLPVVTSSCGSQNEAVLDKVTGWIFDEKDVAALARIILMLLSDDECITEAGIAARNHVENNFDITDCTRLLETRYERITAST